MRALLPVILLGLPSGVLAQTTYDAKILEYTGLKYACDGGVTPLLRIKNIGSATMGGCVVETWKNGIMVNSFDWQLAIPALQNDVRQPALPPVGGVDANDALEFRIISVNTVPDEDPVGNIMQIELDETPALATGGDVEVEVSLGDDPGSVTWSVKNGLAQVVASGGPYEDANTTVTEALTLDPGGCYTFFAEDALRSVTASSVRVQRDGNTLINATDLSSLYHKGLKTGNGGPCSNNLELELATDAFGSQDHWEITVQGTGEVVCSGGPYADAIATQIEACCLPDGCYQLRVFDDAGDGITGGGYVLRSVTGRRIIDNTGNFGDGAISAIANNEGFCLPLGTDRLIGTSCDKLDWRPNEYIVVNPIATVSAQYGVNNANSGYQMWWFDPNGGYSFRRFQSHNTANGLAASSTRACHFKINNWTGNQLANNVLYNVRVRGRVNGSYSEWGPACRFMLDPLRAQCPLTQLMNIEGNTQYSCGSTRGWGGGNTIAALPVHRLNGNNVLVSANRYEFRFRLLDGTLITTRSKSTYILPLNWSIAPLVPGTTYKVDVRASFDNGATWCSDFIAPALTDPWGPVCTLTIAVGGELRDLVLQEDGSSERIGLIPNPAHGQGFMITIPDRMKGLPLEVGIFDPAGKRIHTMRSAPTDGTGGGQLWVDHVLSPGLYLVCVSDGNGTLAERLIVQP